MFRYEPHAEFRCREDGRPDRLRRGIRIVARSYFLDPGRGAEPIKLSTAFGEAISRGLNQRPEPLGRAESRYWWIYGDRIYSTPDRLSRSDVLRLANRERPAVSRPPEPAAARSATRALVT